MPPITLHMVLARRVADDLALAELETGRGPYLLGATTPDIRMLTRQDREATHFFKLNEIEHQDSVAGFFAVHGHLAESAGLNDDTRAFVAGYLTHLIFDELYITGVYRPYFAKHDELGGHLRAEPARQVGLDLGLEALDRRFAAIPELEEVRGRRKALHTVARSADDHRVRPPRFRL